VTVDAARSSRTRWIVVALVVWGLLLTGLAVWSHRRDAPTVREQRTLAEAAPRVTGAVTDLLAAVGDSAVPTLDPVRIASGCRITPLRDGAELTATIRLYAAPEATSALLERIASNLPARYSAGASATALRADAGEFVAVRGRESSPGVVLVVVTTGCRPVPSGFALDEPAIGLPVDGQPARVLTALGAQSIDPGTRALVGCPGGGFAATATAVGRGPALEALSTAGGTAILNTPGAYAFREGDLGYAVTRAGDDGVRVAVTQGC
jgi:hypothetical protein